MNIEHDGFHLKLPLSKYQGNNWYWQGNKDEYTVFIIMQDFVFLKKSVNIYYYRIYKESQYSYKILKCLKSCLSSDVQLNTCTGIKHQNQSIYHDSCFSVHNIPCALHIDILWIRNWSSVIYLFYNWITRFLLYGHFIPMYT